MSGPSDIPDVGDTSLLTSTCAFRSGDAGPDRCERGTTRSRHDADGGL